MNVCLHIEDFDDLNILRNDLNVSFGIFAITESCIKRDSSSFINLQLGNY